MKKLFLAFIFLIGNYFISAQSIVNVMIECYEEYYGLNLNNKHKQEEASCPPEPENFYDFFKTTFIDFQSLREDKKVKTFSFNDTPCSPLYRKLEITSNYGMRGGKKHFGVDFRLNVGDTVCSIFCGKVRIAKWDDAYGYVVVVRHYNMSETVYAHLDKILVSVNQEVKVGETIGLGGNTGKSTGPHLHFELRYKGYPINPVVNKKFLTLIPTY
jgi:murein DD-endopeptidase MepM/ murein hydrolase activator NlpD